MFIPEMEFRRTHRRRVHTFSFRFSLPCLFAYPPAYSRVVTRHVKETYKDYTCYGRINPQAESIPREWLLESWVIGPPPLPKMLSYTNLLYSLISSIIFRTFVTSLSPITRICINFFSDMITD